MSLCEVHGRLLSGTAGSMLREDSPTREKGKGYGPSVPSFVPFFFRSGQEQGRRITITRSIRRIMMTERTMTVPKSPNCVTRLLFVYIVPLYRHLTESHRKTYMALNVC